MRTRKPAQLLLALFGELVVDRVEEPVPATLIIDVLDGADIAAPTTRATLHRMATRDILEPVRRGREIGYLLTESGVDVLRALAAVGPDAIWAAAALALSHGISFLANFVGAREYAHTNLLLVIFQPYLRMWLVMVALGAGLVAAALLPAAAATGAFAAAVILVKTAADLVMHRLEHRRRDADESPPAH